MPTRVLERCLLTRYGFGAVLAGALLVMALNEMGYQHAGRRLADAIALTDARMQAAQTLQWLTDAETAVRGHVLAGDPDGRQRLQPYRDALAGLPAAQQRTFALMRRIDPDLQAAERLQQQLSVRLAALADIVALADRAPAQALAAAAADARQQPTAALRRSFDEVLDRASALQHGARDALSGAIGASRLAVHLLTLVAVAGLYLRMRQLHSADRWRRQSQARLAGEVGERTTELRELAGRLVTVREDERSRLARDLHDELGGQFTAMKLEFARLRGRGELSDAQQAALASLERRLNDAIAFKRRVIENLRPSALDQLGLTASLSLLCQDVAQAAGFLVAQDIDLPRGRPCSAGDPALPLLAPEAELTVYRLVQESLTNVAKYAGASQVQVGLQCDERQLRVRVEDNGRGFDPQRVGPGHLGLIGMRYRVESHGGTMRVESKLGRGTRIEATLPLQTVCPANAPVGQLGAAAGRLQDFTAVVTL